MRFLDLLTRTFCALLISWFVMVTPHAVFQDYFLKGRLMSIGTFMNAHYETVYAEMRLKNSTVSSITTRVEVLG